MYKCSKCKQTVGPRVGQVKVVLEVRSKTYTNEVKLEKGSKVVESTGWEVAKEASMCPPCAQPYAREATDVQSQSR